MFDRRVDAALSRFGDFMIFKRILAALFGKKVEVSPAAKSHEPTSQSSPLDEFSSDPWIQFMVFGSKPHGHSLVEIIDFSRGDFDADHYFVQWLFPNRAASPVNILAPVLTDLHVRAFQALPELRASVDLASAKFLAFLGFREVADGFEQIYDYEKGVQYWLRPLDHNHRRISRFLTFHCEIGCKDKAVALLAHLEGALAPAGLSHIDALPYWRAIVAKADS
mgnify:FL=1